MIIGSRGFPYLHFGALACEADSLFRQTVDFKHDGFLIPDGVSGVEGEGNIDGLTRRDDLSLEVMSEMCGWGV